MSSITAITAQSSSLTTTTTPSRNLPTSRETSLNINNKNLNGRSRTTQVTQSPAGQSQRSAVSTGPVMTVRSHQKIRVTVLCARSLAKRDLFRLPDPFVRVHVDGSGQSHATESCKNTLDPKWNVYYDLLLSSEDAITISVWNDKKIHSKKDGGVIKLNNAGAFLGCVKLLSNAIQRLKDTGEK